MNVSECSRRASSDVQRTECTCKFELIRIIHAYWSKFVHSFGLLPRAPNPPLRWMPITSDRASRTTRNQKLLCERGTPGRVCDGVNKLLQSRAARLIQSAHREAYSGYIARNVRNEFDAPPPCTKLSSLNR